MAHPAGRIAALDALRGFAIFGIVLINIQVFSGWGFLGDEGRAPLSLSPHDDCIDLMLDLIVRAKFYSLFALLFGYSFTMMADRIGSAGTAMYLKRMASLMLIGLAHSLLLWPWDILLLYAVMGLFLTPFLQRGTALPFVSGLAMLALVWLLQWQAATLGLPAERGVFMSRVLQDGIPVFSSGSYPEVLKTNFWLTLGVGQEWLYGYRPLRVLGLFLIGAAAASLSLAARDNDHRSVLWTAAAVGLGAGLYLSLIEHGQLAGAADGVVAMAETLAPPLLAIGYASMLLLFWHTRWKLADWTCRLFAPVGRMALTNYLLQSAVCVPLFYGFGFGVFAEWSLAQQMQFCLALFAGQIVFSHLWLALFQQGPMERLWRMMIGRRPDSRT